MPGLAAKLVKNSARVKTKLVRSCNIMLDPTAGRMTQPISGLIIHNDVLTQGSAQRATPGLIDAIPLGWNGKEDGVIESGF
jgi:hypothetical protein